MQRFALADMAARGGPRGRRTTTTDNLRRELRLTIVVFAVFFTADEHERKIMILLADMTRDEGEEIVIGLRIPAGSGRPRAARPCRVPAAGNPRATVQNGEERIPLP